MLHSSCILTQFMIPVSESKSDGVCHVIREFGLHWFVNTSASISEVCVFSQA